VTRRIALISEHASPLAVLGGVDSGGQNVYVGQVAKHLAALGYDVDVFTRRDSDVLPDVAPWVNGVRIVHLPAGPPTFLEKERLLEHMDAFTEAFLEHARRRRRSYDLVHANFFMSGLVAAEAKRRLGIPFVITFHALGKVRRLHQGAADRFPDERFAIEERCVAEADHVIAECPQDEEDLIRLYGADPARTTIVPAGVDPGEFWPMSPQLARLVLGFDPHERIVLHVGRIVPRKGIDTVIRGFASLVHDRGVAARLVIVGGESDDPDPRRAAELRPLRRVARDEGVDHLVTFTGRQPPDRLKQYYSAADVSVTTPWYEPFGITPLESMACGTPVIGANVGGIKFSVRDGETGYLIPPGDAGAIADRIAHLYRHPRLREVLGRNGVRRVKDMFTWGHVARSLAAIYEDVLAASGRGGRPADAHVRATVASGFDDAISTLRSSRELLRTAVIQAADVLASVFARGGKLLVCGNGGSAADAQHFAAEFVGRFKDQERPGLPAIALTADTSVLTAWSNDVGFDSLFARQVQALGRPGDALVAISTSGRSPNVVAALEEAAARGLRTIALLGRGGGDARSRAELSLVVPSEDTQRIQETQIVVLHVLCELVEERLFSRDVEVVPARAGTADGERGAAEREAG
jgi:D-inositol-3-phosphate glycosyltransferase